MAYGSVLTDVVQSSTSGTPPQFNDGNGTQVGTLCRAWVNYKGTATRAINASFNVSSVTYNSTGNYTLNFTTALNDANYSAVGIVTAAAGTGGQFNGVSGQTSSAFTFTTTTYSGAAYADAALITVAIFR